MATEQMIIVDKKTDESKMSPSKDPETVSREPLDFQKLKPSQFGITVQSFSPAASGSKENSHLAKLKARRRRSNVGVRGSPETNSLIRFIAQQKLKNSSNCQTPEQLVRGSPFLPRVASTLKQKIASFQTLVFVEESEVCDQDDNAGGCMTTKDYLSDEHNQEGKENHHRAASPTPSKKRRVGPLKGCEVQIRVAHTPDLPLNGRDKEGDKEPVAECNDDVKTEPVPSSETEEETQPVLPCTPLRGYRERHMSLEHCAFSSKNNQQENVFEPQSPSRPQPSDLTSLSPEGSFSVFQFSSLPSQSSEASESSGTSAEKKKKKRVHFGCPLSPEFFDKQLPPSTPLQKGQTPARASTPGGILKKTPQRSESFTLQAQRDLCSMFGASPAPMSAMSQDHRMLHMAEDGVEKFEKIIFPSTEDSDSTIMSGTELMNYTQLNLNDAFNDEALSPAVPTDVKSEIRPAYESKALNERESLSEEKRPEVVGDAAPRLKNWENKAAEESESTSEFPAARTRKRKLPEKSQPVRRSTRSAAKPSETIKLASKAAANRWKREVNLSLYGSRTYASKNPSLSPITELFQSVAAQRCLATSCADESAYLKNNTGESESSGPWTSVCIGESSSEALLSSGKKASGTNRSSSRPRTTRRGSRKGRVSMHDLLRVEPQMQTDEKASENHEEEVTTNTTGSIDGPSEQVSNDAEEHCTLIFADTTSAHADPNSDCCHLVVEGSTSACLLGGEQTSTVALTSTSPRTTQQAQNTSRCLRRSVNPAEEQPQAEAETQPKTKSNSSCEYPEEEAQVDCGPASWKADFNFEDVFKRRGQRSVRRSLRNQRNTDNDSGLAWVPRISPEIRKRTVKKMQNRRFSSIV
ncbi:cell division cycle-associated protein 2 isoform X3 [Syngnathus scovelli]|nr:cell division cycle-associated protein 2 isoform X3 [Syngnathus scovelli]XP_049618848.1 cell division cycle-associated protein 2 isoform X3 [Syngnathus scovelli]XP_049618849.1 cell division cycle-associated protein 2 isoform X3 [Syngnathus scovelli]XP_049618850.1 cell division cycle-associated protein 2 isoform X3 [Syngnathus scovelli]